ncbi:hypothetical protein MASR2M78_36290 [Treponema sp.]
MTRPRALVFIDDEKANLGVNYLSEGFHTVRARAFGYEDQWKNIFIARGTHSYLGFALEEASFSLDALRVNRSRFNPNNPGLLGQTEITFEVSAAGSAFIQIKNLAGTEVFARNLKDFTTWNQAISWDGRNQDGEVLDDGLYTAYIRSEGMKNPIHTD